MKAAHRTPGRNSQVDLWGTSDRGDTLHLFELKTAKNRDNRKVGIIPEALYYARLLHYVRSGLPDGGQISWMRSADGLEAARAAKRIIVWLAAPEYHPLVRRNGESPLEWINNGIQSQGMEFRVLPILKRDGKPTAWKTDEMWPY